MNDSLLEKNGPSNNGISNEWKICVNVVIMIFALFGNMLLIASLIKTKNLKESLPNIMILNLASCDIIIVTSSIATDITEINLGYFPFEEFGCRAIYPLSTYAMITGIFTLVLLSTERFIAVVYPFRYRMLKRVKCYPIVLVHMLSICCVVPYGLHLHLDYSEGDPVCIEAWSSNASRIYTVFLFSIQYAIPLPILVSLYSYTWFCIKRQNDEIIRVAEQQRQRVGRVDEEEIVQARFELMKRSKKIKKKCFLARRLDKMREKRKPYNTQLANLRHRQTVAMLKLFICIGTVFAIFMLPNQITWIYLTIENEKASDTWLTIAYWLTYANSILNPIIYGINPKIRRAYLKQILRFLSLCCKQAAEPRRRLGSISSFVSTDTTFLTTTDLSMFRRHASFSSSAQNISSDPIESEYNKNNVSHKHKISSESITNSNATMSDEFPSQKYFYEKERIYSMIGKDNGTVSKTLPKRDVDELITGISDNHFTQAGNGYIFFQEQRNINDKEAKHIQISALRNSICRKYYGEAKSGSYFPRKDFNSANKQYINSVMTKRNQCPIDDDMYADHGDNSPKICFRSDNNISSGHITCFKANKKHPTHITTESMPQRIPVIDEDNNIENIATYHATETSDEYIKLGIGTLRISYLVSEHIKSLTLNIKDLELLTSLNETDC